MFGFLHGPRHHQRYRQIYASCGSSLRGCQLPSIGCNACCDCCGLSGCDSGKSKAAASDLAALDPSNADRGPQLAEVVVALAPYGTVRRFGERAEGVSVAVEEPAKCKGGGMIEAAEKVVIVRKEAFGLLVRRMREKTGSPDEPPAT